MTEQIQCHMPASEKDIKRLNEGELVKITANTFSISCLFTGHKNGRDHFVAQARGESNLIVSYSSSRFNQRYSANEGVILDTSYRVDYIAPNNEEYSLQSAKLKEAGLWKE